MSLNIITNSSELQPGMWYAIGIKDLDDNIDWGWAPIYRYEGNDEWTNDSGSDIEYTLCVHTQCHIHISDADAFMPQC
jgi:hypothetical protein